MWLFRFVLKLQLDRHYRSSQCDSKKGQPSAAFPYSTCETNLVRRAKLARVLISSPARARPSGSLLQAIEEPAHREVFLDLGRVVDDAESELG